MKLRADGQHAREGVDGPWFAIVALPIIALMVPAALVLDGPLQSNGWPARLVIFWIALAVILGWLANPHVLRRTSPVQVGLWVLLGSLAISYAATGFRVLTEEESAGALRAALVMFPLVIVALAIAATAEISRSDLLLATILIGATFSALVALAQFASPFDFAQFIQPPGMTAREMGSGSRGAFFRVRGASAHPIELGVISGAVLPLGMHFTRFASTHNRRVASAIATVVLFLSIPMSVSRSGVLIALVAVALYSAVLTVRQRLNLVIIGVMSAVLLRAAIPGLLGTVTSTFRGISTDDSISGRTDDYAVIEGFFEQAPVFGQGLGTFRPDLYFFLDNQYLMSLVEGGIIGVLGILAFFVLAAVSARGAEFRATTAEMRSRARAVLSAIVAIAVSGTFFDLFSFAQVTVIAFVLAGVAGALWLDGVQNGRALPKPSERIALAAGRGSALRTKPHIGSRS